MEISFLGATGTVTGSRYLVRSGATTVLVDCGLFQGFKQLRLRNWAPLPVDPAEIRAVVLTHAHIDHSGYLPRLIREGFRGPVYCTAATRDLCAVLLPDAGHLQEEEARYANRHGYSRHKPALPLFTREEGARALQQFAPVKLGRKVDVGGGLQATLSRAGHLLGAACALLTDSQTSVLFSGDLGRPNDLTILPPEMPPRADYLVLESTYGNRRHDSSDPRIALGEVINRTFRRDGVVIIPAFAVGRAQTILYYIQLLKAEGAIPDAPVYLNSPMAVDATHIFCDHAGEHRLTPVQCRQMCAVAKYVNSVEESKALNAHRAPMIIVAASGMATGGRVLHHLKAYAPDSRNTILFAGYQAGGTRGAAMLGGAEAIKIHGEYVPIRAEVAALHQLSGHADYAEILQWLERFEAPPRRVFITHGEPAAADALRVRIEEGLDWPCRTPEYLQTVTL